MTREGITHMPHEIRIPTKKGFLYKNQSLSRTPPAISFPPLGHESNLCPGEALKSYIELTKEDPHEGYIFLHPVSGKPLKAGRISYWMTKAIQLTDEEVKGRAHDVRKVSWSISWTRGVPMDEIVKYGFWQSQNTFINKYLVPVSQIASKCVAGRRVVSPVFNESSQSSQ